MSERHIDSTGQVVVVDKEAGTVSIELPDGKLRYSGSNVEAALKLPLAEEVPADAADKADKVDKAAKKAEADKAEADKAEKDKADKAHAKT